MKANNPFTIQLANGKERTFESAAAMVAWMEQQRGLDYPRSRRNRSTGTQSNRVNANRTTNRKSANDAQRSEAPLARYANRNSSGA